jgi:hypothetical protein
MNTTKPEDFPENLHQPQNTILPLSYVMYLTIRSKFIDALAQTDVEILHKWKEFENKEMEAMEQELLQAQNQE